MVIQTHDGAVEFQFYRPAARQVLIAGDFNGWQNTFFMTRSLDGCWSARIQLAPGSYQFRYCADGQWFPDYAAFGLEPGPFGWNSVVRVDEPSTPEAPPVPVRAPEAKARRAGGSPVRAASLDRRPPAIVARPAGYPARPSRLRIAPPPQRGVALAG